MANRGHLGDGREETEWDALQKKIGAYRDEEGTVTVTEEQLGEIVETAAQLVDPMEHKTLDQLDAMEEDEDEDILKKYRERRMKELKERAARSKFGDLVVIGGADWKREVTDVEGFPVAVLLWQSGNRAAEILSEYFIGLAHKFPDVKFVKIQATDAIPNFPSSSVPTVLLYRDSNITKQWTGLKAFGGADITAEDVEWELAMQDALKTDIEEPPHETVEEGSLRINIR